MQTEFFWMEEQTDTQAYGGMEHSSRGRREKYGYSDLKEPYCPEAESLKVGFDKTGLA